MSEDNEPQVAPKDAIDQARVALMAMADAAAYEVERMEDAGWPGLPTEGQLLAAKMGLMLGTIEGKACRAVGEFSDNQDRPLLADRLEQIARMCVGIAKAMRFIDNGGTK